MYRRRLVREKRLRSRSKSNSPIWSRISLGKDWIEVVSKADDKEAERVVVLKHSPPTVGCGVSWWVSSLLSSHFESSSSLFLSSLTSSSVSSSSDCAEGQPCNLPSSPSHEPNKYDVSHVCKVTDGNAGVGGLGGYTTYMMMTFGTQCSSISAITSTATNVVITQQNFGIVAAPLGDPPLHRCWRRWRRGIGVAASIVTTPVNRVPPPRTRRARRLRAPTRATAAAAAVRRRWRPLVRSFRQFIGHVRFIVYRARGRNAARLLSLGADGSLLGSRVWIAGGISLWARHRVERIGTVGEQ